MDSGLRPSASIAVCITGLQRTLLARPAVASYHEHVARPLGQPDTFVSLSVEANGTVGADTRAAAASEYAARSVVTLGALPAVSLALSKVLPQWFAMARCYDEVERFEQGRERAGRAYAWLYRVRTDAVYFSPIFAPPFGPRADTHVAVPMGGMSAREADRCMSDHAFACPRDRCRPYFHMLDLLVRPSVRAASRGHGRATTHGSVDGRSHSRGNHSQPPLATEGEWEFIADASKDPWHYPPANTNMLSTRVHAPACTGTTNNSTTIGGTAAGGAHAEALLPCCRPDDAFAALLAPGRVSDLLASCRVPPPPTEAQQQGVGAQWLFFWLYGGSVPCRAEEAEEAEAACCGELREFPVRLYMI